MKSITLCAKNALTLLLLGGCINLSINGQSEDSQLRIIPKSPEASTFDKFIDFPTISGTGIPEISIPLYTLNYKGYSLPISISYHASGIKVNDIATPVGLNWVLNAGASISRNILGLPDEYGWFNFDTTAVTSCIFDDVKPYYEGTYDVAPDVFTYSLPGHNGKFIYKGDTTMQKSNSDPIRIDEDFNFYFNSDPSNNFYNDTCLNFTAFDEYGNKYSFLPLVNTAIDVHDNRGGVQSSLDHLNGSGIVEWKLQKISLPTGHEILFTYQPHNYIVSWDDRTSSYYVNLEQKVNCSLPQETYGGFSSYFASYQTYLIKTIETADQKMVFEYTSDTTLSIMQKKLENIFIIDSISTTKDTIQIIEFHHDKYYGDPRLRLLEVAFLGNNSIDSSNDSKYLFGYKTADLPAFGSCSQDLFGYYNANTQIHMIPVNDVNMQYFTLTPANREVARNLISNGVLNEITFPTGGKIKYTFEANSVGSQYAPGLRINGIEYINSDASVAEKKQYEYSDLSGIIHDSLDFYNYYDVNLSISSNPTRYRSERRWTASPISYLRNNNEKDFGFYYGQVTTKTMSGNTVNHIITENYSSYKDIFSIIPYLTERTLIDSNGFYVKKEVSQYSNSIMNYMGWTPFMSYQWDGTDYCNGTTYMCTPLMAYLPLTVFYYRTNTFSLSKRIEKSFFNQARDSLTIETDYEYNEFQLPKKIIKNSSVGQDIVSYIHYADDYNISDPVLNQMKNTCYHLIGKPIDTRTYTSTDDNELLIEGKVNKYSEFGKVLEVYLWQDSVPGSNQSWNSTTYIPDKFLLENSFRYDSLTNNYSDIKTPDKITSYLWGYNGAYPVVKIEGINHDSIDVDIKSWVLSHLFTSSMEYDSIKTEVDSLKIILSELLESPNYLISIYTYRPHVGMTSQTDANGITKYYEYDDLNRLVCIRDKDGFILKRNDYHIK